MKAGTLTDVAMDVDSEPGNKLPVLRMATALAVSFAICKIGTFLAKYFGIQGGSLPAITAIVVILATAFPKQFAYLAPSGEAMALILTQVFFAVIGANGSIRNVIITAPSIFMFSLVQIAVHLGVILGFGKLFRFDFYFWHQMQMLVALQRHVKWPQQKGGVLWLFLAFLQAFLELPLRLFSALYLASK
nr:hypothetical protein CFP56_49393 [Quercus suber]